MKSLQPQKSIFVTSEIYDKETAIEKKMKLLQPRLLGFRLVKYNYLGEQKVYIPYEFLVFHYYVERNITINKNGALDKEGQVAIVFDKNEPHAFFGEMEEMANLEGASEQVTEAKILTPNCSEKEMLELCEETIQRQLLLKTFKSRGKIKLAKRRTFYRPAFLLNLEYKDREFTRYAYLDHYGAGSERIKGLKARVGA